MIIHDVKKVVVGVYEFTVWFKFLFYTCLVTSNSHISTRQENTLDLFYTNQPSLVQNTKTLPALGTSDHDIVFHEMNITIGRKHKTPRTIDQYKKADWDKIRTELKTFQEHYFCKQKPMFSLFWFFMNDHSFLLGLLSANLLSSIIMFSI
jgi:hypothetical protein